MADTEVAPGPPPLCLKAGHKSRFVKVYPSPLPRRNRTTLITGNGKSVPAWICIGKIYWNNLYLLLVSLIIFTSLQFIIPRGPNPLSLVLTLLTIYQPFVKWYRSSRVWPLLSVCIFFYVKLLHAYEIKLFSCQYAFFFQFNLKALTTKLKRVEEKFFFPL